MIYAARSVVLSALALSAAIPAQPPPRTALPPVTSTSTVAISGAGIGGVPKTVSLPFMNNFKGKGDWYVTPTDAHAAFFLSDALATKVGRLDLEMNGTPESLINNPFAITMENNKNTGHKTDQGFAVMVGTAQKSITFAPVDPGDTVTITITKMDMLSFEATFTGTLTELGMMERDGHDAHRVSVSGSIRLHRPTAPPAISTGSWTNCDPVIHDWLNEAENRAPSDCETRFDLHVRTAMNTAFAPLVSSLQQQQWKTPWGLPDPAQPLTATPRSTERQPFTGQGWSVRMQMDPGSPEFQRLKAASDQPDPDLVKEMELIKQGKYAEAQALEKTRKPNNALGDFRDNTEFAASASINSGGLDLVNFHGSFTATPLAGGGTILYLPAAQPPTGGGEGEPWTFVLLGPWSQPTATHLDGETTRVIVKAQLNQAPTRLGVQTVLIRIRSSRELAQNIIQPIDWAALRALIAEK